MNEVSIYASANPAEGTVDITQLEPTRLRCLEAVDCAPSHSSLLMINRAMQSAGVPLFANRQSKIETAIAKVLPRIGAARNLWRSTAGPIFVSLMGLTESITLPFCFWTEMVPLCFDCWPNTYDKWMSFFKRHRIRVAFFSARQSAAYFAEKLPHMTCLWLPEATDPSDFSPYSWKQKNIDVLELGRKDDQFHETIEGPLREANRTHLYEKVKGQIIFPSRADFRTGLARSKISVCFPSSQTHPERSGTVETLTHRYLESMASKCVVIGHAPQELIDLFGYNPVVEVEPGQEYEQIEAILAHPEDVVPLIEKNYKRLQEVGTWKSRVPMILSAVLDMSL